MKSGPKKTKKKRGRGFQERRKDTLEESRGEAKGNRISQTLNDIYLSKGVTGTGRYPASSQTAAFSPEQCTHATAKADQVAWPVLVIADGPF